MKKSSNKPQWWSLLVSAFLMGIFSGGASYTILQFTQTSAGTSSTIGLPNFVYKDGAIGLARELENIPTIRGGETHFRDGSNTQVTRCAQILPKPLENTTWQELYTAMNNSPTLSNTGFIDPVKDQNTLEQLGVCSPWLSVPITSDWHIDQEAYNQMLETNTPTTYPKSSIFTTSAIISFLILMIVSVLAEIILSDDTLAVTNKIVPFILEPFVPKKIAEELSQRISEGIKNPGNFQIFRVFCSMVLFALVLNLMTSAVSPVPFSDANKLGLANYTTCVSDKDLPSIKDMGGISPTGRDENGKLIPSIKPLTKQQCKSNEQYYPSGQFVRIINHWLVQALGPAFANSKTFSVDLILRLLASPEKGQFVGTWWVYEGLLQVIYYWFLMVLVGILMNFKSWLIKNFIIDNNLSGYNPTLISPTTIPGTNSLPLPNSPNLEKPPHLANPSNLRELPEININLMKDRPNDSPK